MIRSGDLLKLDGRASVQFATAPITFRVIRVLDWVTTWEGTVWVEGYQLDDTGHASERRQVYIRPDGVEHIQPTTQKGPVPARR